MRRIGSSLCFAAASVVLIGAAPAQPPAPAKPVAARGLRGARTAKAPAKPSTKPAPAQIASATPPPGDISTFSTDPGQCREACAHTYYFCLAGEDAPSCPQNWSSCLITCNRPPIQSQTTTP
jgi:hypothetical protein